MSKKVKLFGLKALPIWLLVVALVAGGAGAAVGTILAGNVVAEIPVTISQALEAGKPVVVPSGTNIAEADDAGDTEDDCIVDNIPQSVDWLDGSPTNGPSSSEFVDKDNVFGPDRSIGAVNDTQTAFQFAAEIDQHDWYAFAVPLKNASNQDMVVQLTLVFPEGITVEVMDGGGDDSLANDYVGNVTRTGLYTWKFDLEAEADKTTPVFASGSEDMTDSILIVVAASDTIAPGFYTIEGELLQISY